MGQKTPDTFLEQELDLIILLRGPCILAVAGGSL
jgi:hypothetical protein